jgi:hypothetical protein
VVSPPDWRCDCPPGRPWLTFACPGCRQIGEIDLRRLDRHPNAAIEIAGAVSTDDRATIKLRHDPSACQPCVLCSSVPLKFILLPCFCLFSKSATRLSHIVDLGGSNGSSFHRFTSAACICFTLSSRACSRAILAVFCAANTRRNWHPNHDKNAPNGSKIAPTRVSSSEASHVVRKEQHLRELAVPMGTAGQFRTLGNCTLYRPNNTELDLDVAIV